MNMKFIKTKSSSKDANSVFNSWLLQGAAIDQSRFISSDGWIFFTFETEPKARISTGLEVTSLICPEKPVKLSLTRAFYVEIPASFASNIRKKTLSTTLH